MNGCNCCSQPPCPAPLIECLSVSGSCSTSCGEINPEDGKRYLTIITTTTHIDGHISTSTKQYTIDEEGECSSETTTTCSGGFTVTYPAVDGTGSVVETYDYTEDCELELVSKTGSLSNTSSYSYEVDCAGEPGMAQFDETCTSNYNHSTGLWTTRVTAKVTVCDSSYDDDYGDEISETPGCALLGGPIYSPERLSEDVVVVEYSNPTPICEFEFPDFADWPEDRGEEWEGFEPGQSSSCSAFKNWEENLLSKAERKVKWRVKHSPSGTCYLKVWLQRKFQPADLDEDPIYTTITPYVWNGTGNPCFTDTNLPPDHEDNIIIGEPTDEGVPGENGTSTIEIVKWSCVEGYEPDISDEENPQPNGFPDLEWEVAAP